VDSLLPVFHFVREPNWDPVEHPEDVDHPGHEQQQDQLELIVFLEMRVFRIISDFLTVPSFHMR
jgi:hypothetical protein